MVVTGIGAVTPLGGDAITSWKNLVKGLSGAQRISRFDPDGFPCRVACEVPIGKGISAKDGTFNPLDWFSQKDLRKVDDFIIFGVAAAEMALKDSGLDLMEISYINAHATSTPKGDEIELKAIERAFKGRVEHFLSSTKSSIGHLLGAAGAVEAIFSILSIKNNIVPPTINLDDLSIDTKIDLVPHESKEKEINSVLSNSFGFGGTNASVIFSRY